MVSSSLQKPFTIAICGGGIGGLALAIGLLRQNVPFHLYESAQAFAEVGAGVAFGPNSRKAMRLIDENIAKGYNKNATGNAFPELKDVFFSFRWGMDGRGHNEGTKAGTFIHNVGMLGGASSIHRAVFLDELVALMPKECVSFGKRVTKIDQLENGVRLHFQDGSTAEAAAVIGCDGIKSETRTNLLGKDHTAAHAVFSGKYAYRGLIPMDKAAAAIGDELARNSHMHLGYGGHVLTIPIENGKVMNVVAFREKENGIWEDGRWVRPMNRKALEDDFAGWGSAVQGILNLMEKPDEWALFNYPPAPTYTKGRICLMGDAAHASTPHNGAGAGMALEDAFILSNLLGDTEMEADIEKAFRAFDEVQRPRSQKLVTKSAEAGRLYEFELEGVKDDVKAIQNDLDHRYRWIWEEDLDKNLERARGIMREV
ncbi:MAG: hypothetical protein MMC33_001903 [Icmadophila ericetorum]|nr:hypothetical protein [Icmadophila ericetorum]